MRTDALQIRAQVIQAIRRYFVDQGFLEVETPVLIPANAPEEYIDPVLALPWQLQTSPEICMKRLLCRGYSRIFQICRCWRSGERGSRHLSEFTMLEWYRANGSYLDLMEDCRGLLRTVAELCTPTGEYRRNGSKIDPHRTWATYTLQEAFSLFSNTSLSNCLANDCFEEILVSQIEPALSNFSTPVLLYDYPAEMAALARLKQDDRRFAERFELYLGGLELANGFSELNEPAEQRERFIAANRVRSSNGKQPLPLPEPFLAELSAMPDSAGIALGVDRLVMLTCGAQSIDEVVCFTPEQL